MDRGEADEGLAAFEKLLSIAGENKETFNNLGSACAEYALFDAAARYYERALGLDPEYVLSLRNLGKLCMETEQYEKALNLFERLVKKLPRDYEGNWLIAQCLKNLRRADDALVQLQQLAEIAPQSDEVYREMGMIYLNQKRDMESARRMFARSLSLDPNQPDLAMLMTQQQGRIEAPAGMPELVPPMPGVTTPVPQPPFPQIPQIPPTPGR